MYYGFVYLFFIELKIIPLKWKVQVWCSLTWRFVFWMFFVTCSPTNSRPRSDGKVLTILKLPQIYSKICMWLVDGVITFFNRLPHVENLPTMVHLVVDSLDICISFLGAIKYNIYISWESQPNLHIFYTYCKWICV